MTVEDLKTELEKIISDLSVSGFGSIDSVIMEKLNKLAAEAGELNLNEGKHLINNLSGAMKAIQEGKSKAESGSVRLTALDFYFQKISDSGIIEDV